MSERERSRSGNSGGSGNRTVSGDVDIHGKTLDVKIAVPSGAKLSDVLTEVRKHVNLGNLSQYTTLRINDRDIRIEDGKLVEDPVITENFVLSLVKGTIRGGRAR
jgi:hypothetical protein